MFALFIFELKSNHKHENITDWALAQFQAHYETKAEARASARAQKNERQKGGLNKAQTFAQTAESTTASARVSASENGSRITKEDIFYYVYAVLHAPAYRKKYEQNLKREFPRLPFYDDFTRWRDWGKQLMDLHINYESAAPYALERNDLQAKAKQGDFFDDCEAQETFVAKAIPKLRADKENGTILIDSITNLTGVPALGWEYKLGNRSALEWILDQYKERKPSDATIAERFNNYKFADYKEHVIDLLKRVTTVSIRTMEIINQMPES